MATKIVARDAEAKAEIIHEVERMIARGAAISGCTYHSINMEMEVRGMKGVVDDVVRPFIRAGKATYWQPAWKRAV